MSEMPTQVRSTGPGFVNESDADADLPATVMADQWEITQTDPDDPDTAVLVLSVEDALDVLVPISGELAEQLAAQLAAQGYTLAQQKSLTERVDGLFSRAEDSRAADLTGASRVREVLDGLPPAWRIGIPTAVIVLAVLLYIVTHLP